MSVLNDLRRAYHQKLCTHIWGLRNGIPNNADKDSPTSVDFAERMLAKLPFPPCPNPPTSAQTLGAAFARFTKEFLEAAFAVNLQHLRPGSWHLTTQQQEIGQYEQYEHLADLARVIADYPSLKTALGGDYLITPDIVISRRPVTDSDINHIGPYVSDSEPIARMTPLRDGNLGRSRSIMHASISCKLSMRSDRSQNTRTEALNLIRNRKGTVPQVVVVALEPLPSRLASIAMGTGDVDCTYHAALHELMEAATESKWDGQGEILNDLVVGRRLRDISDLPLDLAI